MARRIASLVCQWAAAAVGGGRPREPVSPPAPPGSKPLGHGARQQPPGFAAELQTPFIRLRMMGAEGFPRPLVPPSGKCNIYIFF